MSNIKDFEIEKTTFKKYLGNGKEVILPEGIKEIGENAFYQCVSLKSLSIPSSVTKTSPCCAGFIVPGSTLIYGSNF